MTLVTLMPDGEIKEVKTLRDEIAIAVLPVLVARFADETMRPHAAKTAYAIADDMLMERETKGEMVVLARGTYESLSNAAKRWQILTEGLNGVPMKIIRDSRHAYLTEGETPDINYVYGAILAILKALEE